MAYHLLRLCAVVLVCLAAVPRPVLTNPIDTVTSHGSATTIAEAVTVPPTDVSSTTPDATVPSATEGSKMSRFLDDFTSAFKQSTAKMKESLESAATSVKDGVLQGYDYVRNKLTGAPTDGPAPISDDPLKEGAVDSGPTVAALTSTAPSDPAEKAPPASASPSTEGPAISGPAAAGSSLTAYGGAVGVSNEPAQIVPNDDDDDERIIFNDKDYTAEKGQDPEDDPDVTESPATTGVTLDNRFIIASPLACKSGQEVVNGKCRNVF